MDHCEAMNVNVIAQKGQVKERAHEEQKNKLSNRYMGTKEWCMENKRIKRKNSQQDQRYWESTQTGKCCTW